MTQPKQAESAFLHAESATNHGVSAPNQFFTHSPVRARMLKFIAAAGISLGSLAAVPGCGGDDEGVAPLSGDGGADACGNNCGTNTHCNNETGKCEQGSADACNNSCGKNTHCNTTTKKCDPDTNADACGNACGANTACNHDTGKCEPVSSKYAGVTWKNSNPGSGNGWVDVSNGSDGDYKLGYTAGFSQAESPSTVCFVGYGSGTILTMNGSGEWWNVQKPWLAGQTGHSVSDNIYFASKQAAKDTAAQLLTYRSTAPANRPANAFVWRAAGSNQSWADTVAVGSDQSAIHCSYVPNNGVVEKY